jgi:hypothetical protein
MTDLVNLVCCTQMSLIMILLVVGFISEFYNTSSKALENQGDCHNWF